MLSKKIAVVGTGYVGLVTGVALSEIGHTVTCVEIDKRKLELLKDGISPIYEPGLTELMKKNLKSNRLKFTSSHGLAFKEAEVIYIAVGTPPKEDGTADLQYIESVARDIADNLSKYTVIVTKSTVPVGTNDYIEKYIKSYTDAPFDVVSNPEFLREGSAIQDTFNGDRIVIGADSDKALHILKKINEPFSIPIFSTDIRSAEMIKYASNAFLATKISFINEIGNLCEKLNSNVKDVAIGMGYDKRIGEHFLNAGIGYGGSCFPKDTSALVQIAGNVEHEFTLLKAVIEVNNKQQRVLIQKAKSHFGSLSGKVFAILGTSFKPNTDDMREAASIVIARELISEGAKVIAYDPVAMEVAKNTLPKEVEFSGSAESALMGSDAAFIVTEWDEFTQIKPSQYISLLKYPVVFDGRNCFNLNEVNNTDLIYYSIGRPVLNERQG